jgi:hypothetical protein
LGLGDWLGDWLGEAFDWRRIRENLCKLRPRTIERIGRQRGAQRPAGAKLAEELG